MTQIPPAAPGSTPTPNAYKAILRSLMPFIESTLVALVAHLGWKINLATAAQIVVVVGGALTVLLHTLEARWPWFGALLGAMGRPAYPPSVKNTLAAQVTALAAERTALQAQLDAVAAAARQAAPVTGGAPAAPAPTPAP